MLNTSKILFLLFLVVFLHKVESQTSGVKFQNLTLKDGLSHSLVTSMVEDDNGFLWFATHNGLNRYDGYSFKKYFAGKSNKSLLKNRIIKLFKDSFGEIWIHYKGGGVGKLIPETDTFKSYHNDSLDVKSISSEQLIIEISGLNYTMFFEDSNHELWIASDKGINKYNRDSDNFTTYQFNSNNSASLSNNSITSIAEDNFGYLWIGTIDGLNRLNKSTGEIKRVLSADLNPELINAPVISKIFPQNDGSLWVGTINMGLLIIDDANSKAPIKYTQYINNFNFKGFAPSVFEIVKTSRGIILLGTRAGVYQLTENKGVINIEQNKFVRKTKISHIVEDENGFIWIGENSGLTNNYLYRFNETLSDFEIIEGENHVANDPISFIKNVGNGLVFVGTVKGGIYKMNINAKKFGLINDNPSKGVYLTSNKVHSIYEDATNNLWVGTDKELNVLNLKTGFTKDFKNFLQIKDDINYSYSKNISAKRIGVIKKTNDDKLWFGALDYKVSLYNPIKNNFLNFHNNPKDSASFIGWSLRTICVTKSGQTYFGGAGVSFCKLNPDGFTFKHYKVSPKDDFKVLLINTIIEDKDELIWMGTLKGLKSFNQKTEKITSYFDDSSVSNKGSDNVISILEPTVYEENSLWLGTSIGLKKFNKETGTFKLFTVKDGLPNNTIVGILEDDEGYLWMSTLNGLVKFNPLNNKFNNYTQEDGIQSNEFNEGAYFKNNEGVMYFGGINGITYFNPKEIVDNSHHGKVILTALKVNQRFVNAKDTINGNVILQKSISYTNEITLTNNDKIVSFEFASTNMVASNKTKYKYKLEGHENEWNEVDANQRFANYSNLTNGTYTFVINNTNSDGIWSETPLMLKINVLPPFWKKLWVKLTGLGILILSIGVYLQLKTRKLKQQKLHLEKVVEERTVELKVINKNLENKNQKISQMSEKIHELDSMKLRFFTNISHEFRTPLTLILGPTKKLIETDNFEDTVVVKDNLKIIHRNSKRLYNLINQLLELPKVDSGSLKLLVSKQDIISNAHDILTIFKDYAHSKEITLNFSSKLETYEMYFDGDKIEKILYNLLSNAINYTPKGGTVELILSDIETLDSKEVICISIKNSGKGIKKVHLKQIFDRFYQIQRKTNTGDISTGIGLSLVKSLVDIHKGKIDVKSETDKGATFKVSLPIDKNNYKPEEILNLTAVDSAYTYTYSKSMLPIYTEPATEVLQDENVAHEKTKIIIIEDHKDLNTFLYNELKDKYHVLTAFNGKEGLDLVQEELPDLVISDVMMPVMDGIALCKAMKTNIATSHIPVFLLTAKIDQEHQVTGLGTGADDYITKPFNIDTLKLKINNIIKARKILIAKFSSDLKPIPEGINLTELDHNLLENIIKYVEDNIDTEITGDILGAELGLSKSNLYKKLKDLTGFSVNIYVRNIRLNVAAKLLTNGKYSISEVAYAIGFNNPKYFSTCFHKLFGKTPREFMQNDL